MVKIKKSGEKDTGPLEIKRSLRDEATDQLARSQKDSLELKMQTAESLIHELQVHQIELEMQAEELRRAHLALEESRDRYIDLYDFAPVGYLTLTDKGIVTGINLTGASLLNVPRTKLIRERFSKFIAEKDIDQWHWYIKNILNQEEKLTCELALRREDGSIFPVRIEGIRITDIIEGIQTVRMMISDITNIQQIEEALGQANRKLNLLSRITRHDINNQLMVLMGNLTLMDKEHLDKSSGEHLKKVEIAVERIAAMIRFTKEYEDIGVRAPFWQDVRTLVRTASADVPLDKISLVNDVPTGTEVFADPMISKVFHNLIQNAVRHGGNITTIHFFLKEHFGVRDIVCEDDGAGIPVDMKEKLFTQGFGKDHGLGLFLSREILAISGIMITEEGRPGHGAKFVMTMPQGGLRTNPT